MHGEWLMLIEHEAVVEARVPNVCLMEAVLVERSAEVEARGRNVFSDVCVKCHQN